MTLTKNLVDFEMPDLLKYLWGPNCCILQFFLNNFGKHRINYHRDQSNRQEKSLRMTL